MHSKYFTAITRVKAFFFEIQNSNTQDKNKTKQISQTGILKKIYINLNDF